VRAEEEEEREKGGGREGEGEGEWAEERKGERRGENSGGERLRDDRRGGGERTSASILGSVSVLSPVSKVIIELLPSSSVP
jgi:hypothetical protein